MNEYVGKVLLDYEYYPGEDLYSDGDVEDELLRIASYYNETEFNREIAKRRSWPVLYHFSHVRENVVNWLPITKKDRVLEVGSGCGAVTGALARLAGFVTCVDLSKKRSLVNANRHKDCENLEILVGNFQDIEEHLPADYDYITLIGVFEYSEGYIGGERPYVNMLKKLARHLAPGGKIVLAIENRLGLKYWAGCAEDHNGLFFEGLEGYPTTQGAKTFSKKELEEIIAAAGEYRCQFYYPYPDYKFPTSIYSDERLPAVGELREHRYNFDRARLKLFDETRVCNTLITNGLYPVYANSFLVLLSPKRAADPTEEILYVKHSNERDERFSIRTEVLKKPDGSRLVRKRAAGKAGEGHLNHINISYQLLKGLYRDTSIEMNRCKKGDGMVTLEYITGRTLEEMLDELLADGQIDKLWETLDNYLEVLRKSGSTKLFTPTAKFQEVFGAVQLPDGLFGAEVSNVDCICSNLVWDGQKEKWQMLDYEWTFAFPIPVHFLIYRVLHYYLYSSTMRNRLLEEDFFGRAGITPAEQEIYGQMEENFQRYITGKLTPMRAMYDSISPGVLMDLKNGSWEKQYYQDCLQVYTDLGSGFSEENSWLLPCKEGRLRGVIALPKGAKRVRLDPTDKCCMVRLECLRPAVKEESMLSEENFSIRESLLPFTSNGCACGPGEFFFDTTDPQFLLEDLSQAGEGISFAYQVTPCDPAVASLFYRQREALEECQTDLEDCRRELSQKKEQIHAMENTKVWKAYRAIKRDKHQKAK